MTSMLNRRLFAAGLILLPASAGLSGPALAQTLSAADQALVDKAVDYLQGLTLARGRFIQTDPRNRRAGGDFYLSRPGKIRFDYDSPNELLVISDGNQVAVKDDRLGTFDRYPLRSTPLSIFLGNRIRLGDGARVTDVSRSGETFAITAASREGQITLTFAENPMRLKEWTVVDGQRQRTRVELGVLTEVTSLDPDLFRFEIPRGPSRRPG